MGDIFDSPNHYSTFNEENNFARDKIDEFFDPGISDQPDISRYQTLRNKSTILTASEQAELTSLSSKLKNKILSTEMLNKVFQSISYMQEYFKNNTVDLISRLKTEVEETKNSAIETINSAVDKCKEDLQSFVTDCKSSILLYMKRLTAKNTYSETETYYQCNIVLYTAEDGTTDVYLCINDLDGKGIKGISPTSDAYWSKLSLKGDKGEAGANFTWEGSWDYTKTYSKSALVSYNGVMCVSKVDNNLGNTPPTLVGSETDYWFVWQQGIVDGSVTEEKLSDTVKETITNSNKIVDSANGITFEWICEDGEIALKRIS